MPNNYALTDKSTEDAAFLALTFFILRYFYLKLSKRIKLYETPESQTIMASMLGVGNANPRLMPYFPIPALFRGVNFK